MPYLLALAAYFTIGCMVLTANTVITPVEEEYGLLHASSAMLITFLSLGNLIMGAAGNLVTARFGRRRMLFIYAALIVVSYALFALLPVPAAWYPLMLLAGISWGGINTLNNTVVAELYDGSASRLNILHASYAVGAILFPLIVGFLTAAGFSWRIPVVLVSVIALLLLIFSWFVRLPEAGQAASNTDSKMKFWRMPGFYLAVATFFTYVGVESSAGAWLSGYLSSVNTFFAENVPAQTMVSLMWGMMLCGRLLFSAVGARLDKYRLLVLLSCGYLLGMLGIVFLSASTPLAILSVAVMGLSMSAIYGTAVANFSRYITGSPIASGIILGIGGLGSACIPFLAGKIADAGSLRTGMIFLAVILVLLVGITAASSVVLKKEDA